MQICHCSCAILYPMNFRSMVKDAFRLSVAKPKPRPKWNPKEPMRGQRETSKLHLRRENAGDQGMIGFSFVFWLVESWPITDRNKVNRPGGFIIYENNKRDFSWQNSWLRGCEWMSKMSHSSGNLWRRREMSENLRTCLKSDART